MAEDTRHSGILEGTGRPARGAKAGDPGNLGIQCRQCSEHFSRRTLNCPRCGRLNDRNYLVILFRVLVVLIFIGAAAWAGWRTSKDESTPAPEAVKKLRGQEHRPDGQPELRF